jgi:hypothetical protein
MRHAAESALGFLGVVTSILHSSIKVLQRRHSPTSSSASGPSGIAEILYPALRASGSRSVSRSLWLVFS